MSKHTIFSKFGTLPIYNKYTRPPIFFKEFQYFLKIQYIKKQSRIFFFSFVKKSINTFSLFTSHQLMYYVCQLFFLH